MTMREDHVRLTFEICCGILPDDVAGCRNVQRFTMIEHLLRHLEFLLNLFRSFDVDSCKTRLKAT